MISLTSLTYPSYLVLALANAAFFEGRKSTRSLLLAIALPKNSSSCAALNE